MNEEITIILDDNDLRFDYTEVELAKFRRLWSEYRKRTADSLAIINQLAKDLKTTPDNIFLLTLDQTRKGMIH